jgi:hypothetical protein
VVRYLGECEKLSVWWFAMSVRVSGSVYVWLAGG